jgi:hypothetical protein
MESNAVRPVQASMFSMFGAAYAFQFLLEFRLSIPIVADRGMASILAKAHGARHLFGSDGFHVWPNRHFSRTLPQPSATH